jgi:hypothetical protein
MAVGRDQDKVSAPSLRPRAALPQRCRGDRGSVEVEQVAVQEPPKSRLLAHAPNCSRCRKPMKVRTLLPGRKVDDSSIVARSAGRTTCVR